MSDVDQSGPTCRLSIAQQMYDVCGLLHNNNINCACRDTSMIPDPISQYEGAGSSIRVRGAVIN